jgi:hypothetical protein
VPQKLSVDVCLQLALFDLLLFGLQLALFALWMYFYPLGLLLFTKPLVVQLSASACYN